MVQYSRGLDQTFSALSDATRRDIIERLGQGAASITELAEPFGMSLTGVKKHVLILEEAGLVTSKKKGRVRECRLGPSRLDEAAHWIDWYREQWDKRLDRLEALVSTGKGAE